MIQAAAILQVLRSPAAWAVAGVVAVLACGYFWGEKRYTDGRVDTVQKYEAEEDKTHAKLIRELQDARRQRARAEERARKVERQVDAIRRDDASEDIRRAVAGSRCADLGDDFLRVFNDLQSRHFDSGGNR